MFALLQAVALSLVRASRRSQHLQPFVPAERWAEVSGTHRFYDATSYPHMLWAVLSSPSATHGLPAVLARVVCEYAQPTALWTIACTSKYG